MTFKLLKTIETWNFAILNWIFYLFDLVWCIWCEWLMTDFCLSSSSLPLSNYTVRCNVHNEQVAIFSCYHLQIGISFMLACSSTWRHSITYPLALSQNRNKILLLIECLCNANRNSFCLFTKPYQKMYEKNQISFISTVY